MDFAVEAGHLVEGTPVHFEADVCKLKLPVADDKDPIVRSAIDIERVKVSLAFCPCLRQSVENDKRDSYLPDDPQRQRD